MSEEKYSPSYFVAQIGHELRTPLNAIKGFGDLLLEGFVGDLNEEQKKYLSRILGSADDLLKIVNQILDWAKLESNEMKLSREWLELWRLGAEMRDLFELSMKEKNLSLEVEIDPSFQIYGDLGRLRQVLINLINNAMKFTNEGGKIRLYATEKTSHIVLAVTDSGVGMDEETKRILFEPFKKKSQGRMNTEGTGLGLWIVQSIMKLHYGYIEVESEKDKGSTFLLYFPKGVCGDD